MRHSSQTTIIFILFVISVSITNGGKFGDTSLRFVPQEAQQTWDYVTVREGAHMFWWLYYTTAAEGYQNKPLVIWLQGGPGGSSTGFGNFGEIGPLDVNLKPRSTNWVSEASILFVDNPVGAGFSYVDYPGLYTTDVEMIAQDLLVMLQHVMKKLPEFQKIPLYIFSESYGGKMAAAFSLTLHKAIKAGSVQCNFRGVALGDSWISPLDSVMTWGPYLRATSLVDLLGLLDINNTAVSIEKAIAAGQFEKATDLWALLENIIENRTSGVNFYNILQWSGVQPSSTHRLCAKTSKVFPNENLAKLYRRHVKPLEAASLSELMNGLIRKKLGIIPKNVIWGAQSGDVFKYQSGDFMKPVVKIVDELLQTTNLSVVVYNGQLDLIVDTLGTEQWVQQLSWPGLAGFNQLSHRALRDEQGTPLAFYKSYKNLAFYWILNAGHMVPADAGEAAVKMLRMITQS